MFILWVPLFSKDSNPFPLSFSSYRNRKFVSGTFNWLEVEHRFPYPRSIVSFDLETESFREILQPNCGMMTVLSPILNVMMDCLSYFIILILLQMFGLWRSMEMKILELNCSLFLTWEMLTYKLLIFVLITKLFIFLTMTNCCWGPCMSWLFTILPIVLLRFWEFKRLMAGCVRKSIMRVWYHLVLNIMPHHEVYQEPFHWIFNSLIATFMLVSVCVNFMFMGYFMNYC